MPTTSQTGPYPPHHPARQTEGALGGKGWGVNLSGSGKRATSEKLKQQALSPEELATQERVYRACLAYKDGALVKEKWEKVLHDSLRLASSAQVSHAPFAGITLEKVLPRLRIKTADKKADRLNNKKLWDPCKKGGLEPMRPSRHCTPETEPDSAA